MGEGPSRGKKGLLGHLALEGSEPGEGGRKGLRKGEPVSYRGTCSEEKSKEWWGAGMVHAALRQGLVPFQTFIADMK